MSREKPYALLVTYVVFVDDPPDRAGEVAFGGSDGFFAGFAFCDAPVDVVGGLEIGLLPRRPRTL
jgi:hypothetical protein